MQLGEPRSTSETIATIDRQLNISKAPSAADKLSKAIGETGTKDSITHSIIERAVRLGVDHRKGKNGREQLTDPLQLIAVLQAVIDGYGMSEEDRRNPCLSMKGIPSYSITRADYSSTHKSFTFVSPSLTSKLGLNIHRDTPTEILHTVLLGIVKYFWGQTIEILDKAKKLHEFNARLNSLDNAGLNIPNIQGDYMCQYRGGLIGKHFKTLAQIMAFATLGLVDDNHRMGWLLIGQLVVKLWYTIVDHMEEYLVSFVSPRTFYTLTRGTCGRLISTSASRTFCR